MGDNMKKTELAEEEIELKYVFLDSESDKYKGLVHSDPSSSIILGAVEDEKKLVGVTVFTIASENADAINLDYIYVDDETRDAGVAKSMLQFAEDFFKKSDVRFIFAKVPEADEEMSPVLSLLESAEYMSTGSDDLVKILW